MRTLFRGITVIAMDDVRGSEPFTADVLVEGDLIAACPADQPLQRRRGDVVERRQAARLILR